MAAQDGPGPPKYGRQLSFMEWYPGIVEKMKYHQPTFLGSPPAQLAPRRARHSRPRNPRMHEGDVTSYGAMQLGPFMAGNETVLQLNLYGCKIGDDGGACIARGLAHNHRLVSLGMSAVNIGQRTLEELVRTPPPPLRRGESRLRRRGRGKCSRRIGGWGPSASAATGSS